MAHLKENMGFACRQDSVRYMYHIKAIAFYSKAGQEMFFQFQDFFFWELETILDPHWDQLRLSKLFVKRNSMYLPEEPITSRVSTYMAYNEVRDSVWGTEMWLLVSKMTSLSTNLFYCVFANASMSHLANSVSIIKYTLLQWLMYGSLPSRWMSQLHGYRTSLPCFIWLGDSLIISTKWNVFRSLWVFNIFKRLKKSLRAAGQHLPLGWAQFKALFPATFNFLEKVEHLQKVTVWSL